MGNSQIVGFLAANSDQIDNVTPTVKATIPGVIDVDSIGVSSQWSAKGTVAKQVGCVQPFVLFFTVDVSRVNSLVSHRMYGLSICPEELGMLQL
jgi:hypothetical protein